MPEAKTRKAVARDKRQGKSASTQAGEFVREEIEHVREGKHGVRSTKQAIAIGLSKARRAGVKAPVSKTASKATTPTPGAMPIARASRTAKVRRPRGRAKPSRLRPKSRHSRRRKPSRRARRYRSR